MKGGGVMEVFPLLRDGAAAGEVTAEREGLYRRFSLRADLPEGVWCVWLVGERGELSLGVPEPDEGAYRLCRRLSARSVEGLGQLLRGEVRPRRQQPEGWNGAPQPACLFHSGWLQRELKCCSGALARREGKRTLLALPCCGEQPFPLVSLFCFAHICRICGREYAVFAFDEKERPVFYPENA